MRADLPTGTVTFLFTDVEGSTKLLQELGAERYADALTEHRRVVRQVSRAHGGVEMGTEGDAFFLAFPTAAGALAAAAEITEELTTGPTRVRIGLHTGSPLLTDEGYVGDDVHLVARIAAAGHGGQVLVSAATAALAAPTDLKRHTLPLHPLGEHRLKDIDGAVSLFQLGDGSFPPLRTISNSNLPRPLPAAATSLFGREQTIDELAGLLERPDVRLVTLTGPGGIGKTRLAMAVGERLRDRIDWGTVFVPLAAVPQPELVLASIGRAVGAELAGAISPLQAVVERVGDDQWLLILDNLEQVLDVARDLDELLARSRGVVILATSRTVLRLRAEREYPVPPLPRPPGPTAVLLAELASSPAVALFVDRARAVRNDFALTPANAPAVVEICRRLEGLPLAIELAAARTRLLDPDSLLRRLASSLDALGTGTVDMPERQYTLRATVEWSVGLLDDAERSLLETVAVFVDGWTMEAAAAVAGLDEDRALDLTEALAGHSLIYLDVTDHGPRSRMLETIRAFVAERLAARTDAAEIQRRHADHYRELAEQADRPLRHIGHREWLELLQAEAGNLAATVHWYLDNDRALLPHLFRVLWPFWLLADHMDEARTWADQLLPAADSLDPQARAELVLTALVTALDVGDDATALVARERLEPLLAGIRDPFLHALSQLAMAWAAPIVDDFDGALRRALVSLGELRRQDEPFWTTMALSSLGGLEMVAGRDDEAAFGHLSEARDLAERFDNAWLAAWSLTLLGTLAVRQGRLGEARALLDEALALSMGAYSTSMVTLCLAGFARLSFVEGDAERAGLLVGAADGLRRRVGLRAWPMLRQMEAELVTQIREALGADRFDQMYADGTRLKQQEAVAAVRDMRRASTQAS